MAPEASSTGGPRFPSSAMSADRGPPVPRLRNERGHSRNVCAQNAWGCSRARTEFSNPAFAAGSSLFLLVKMQCAPGARTPTREQRDPCLQAGVRVWEGCRRGRPPPLPLFSCLLLLCPHSRVLPENALGHVQSRVRKNHPPQPLRQPPCLVRVSPMERRPERLWGCLSSSK